LLGSQSFIDRMKAKYWNLKNHGEVPESKLLSPEMDTITAAVCDAYEKDRNRLLSSRRGITNEARNAAIYLCRRLSGETLTNIGKHFGLKNYGSVSSVVSRMKKTLRLDARLRRKLEGLEYQLRKHQNETCPLILLITKPIQTLQEAGSHRNYSIRQKKPDPQRIFLATIEPYRRRHLMTLSNGDGRKMAEVFRLYSEGSTILVTALMLFILLNGLVLAGGWIRGLLKSEDEDSNYWAASQAYQKVYPAYSPQEIDDLLTAHWCQKYEYEAFTQFREKPRSGTYINIAEAGFRIGNIQGPWPPDRDKYYTVFVFGGSTAFGYGVSDQETVPSYLADFWSKWRADARVYNFGRAAYYSSQERVLFEKLLIADAVPHVAIFIDGLNEFLCLEDEPEHSDYIRNIMDKKDCSVMNLIPSLPLVKSLLDLIRPANGSPDDDHSGTDEVDHNQRSILIEKIASRYSANKKIIKAIADLHGIKVLFVWQPVPMYKYDLKYHLFYKGDFQEFWLAESGYPVMAEKAKAGLFEPNFLWCADMQHDKKLPLYVDLVHYSAAMSKQVAHAIFVGLNQMGLVECRPREPESPRHPGKLSPNPVAASGSSVPSKLQETR
jgi:hypothetical protein